MTEMTVEKWKQQVGKVEASKLRMKDMSKLFYVHHQNIHSIIKQQQHAIDNRKLSEAYHEIDKVIKGAENTSDPFIATLAKQNNIKSFQKSFKDLSKMIKSSIKLNKQKQIVHSLIKKRAFSATQLRHDNKTNNINQQIKNSTQRLNFVKAGQKISNVIRQPLPRNTVSCLPRNRQQQFKEKRQQLQAMIRTFIVKNPSTMVRIQKKNQKLSQYFGKRKQFTDLFLGYQKQPEAIDFEVSFQPSEESTEQEQHFMTQIGVDTNKIQKSMVKANVDRVIDIVNSKLISDRKTREHQRYQKMRQTQFMKMADTCVEPIKKVHRKSRISRQFETRAEFIFSDSQTNKPSMLATFRTTTASLGRRLYIENTPFYENTPSEQKMARKLSSRKF